MNVKMTAADASTILSALGHYRGDDLERARACFKVYSPAEMQRQHGQSGETRQQILDAYQRHVDRVERAIACIKAAL